MINKNIAGILFIVLVGLSFLKDNFSPDYLNTPSAVFLNPAFHLSRFYSIQTQTFFWFVAICYSACFVYLPVQVVRYYFGNKLLTRYTLIALTSIGLLIYLMIFTNSIIIDRAIVPKVNRFFHSPIITMFFVAAFTIISKKKVTSNK